MSVKEVVLDIAKNLPEKCTWDDVMYRIHVRKQIEAGLKDESEGHFVPHERAFAEIAKRTRSKSGGKR